jgi:hypothetical protein
LPRLALSFLRMFAYKTRINAHVCFFFVFSVVGLDRKFSKNILEKSENRPSTRCVEIPIYHLWVIFQNSQLPLVREGGTFIHELRVLFNRCFTAVRCGLASSSTMAPVGCFGARKLLICGGEGVQPYSTWQRPALSSLTISETTLICWIACDGLTLIDAFAAEGRIGCFPLGGVAQAPQE